MRVLIVFHGRLPGGASRATGIAVRAFTNGIGLEAHGLEVCYASRRRDLGGRPAPGLPPVHPFEGQRELVDLVARLAPDLVLVGGAYQTPALATLEVPRALDASAPLVPSRY